MVFQKLEEEGNLDYGLFKLQQYSLIDFWEDPYYFIIIVNFV